MPSFDGFKGPVRLLVLDWCCTSVGQPTHTSEWSLMKEPYVISNWVFTPVSLWRNYLSSQAGLRSHPLVTTLTFCQICFRMRWHNSPMYYCIESDSVIQSREQDEKSVLALSCSPCSSHTLPYSLKDMMECPLELPFKSEKMTRIIFSRGWPNSKIWCGEILSNNPSQHVNKIEKKNPGLTFQNFIL